MWKCEHWHCIWQFTFDSRVPFERIVSVVCLCDANELIDSPVQHTTRASCHTMLAPRLERSVRQVVQVVFQRRWRAYRSLKWKYRSSCWAHGFENLHSTDIPSHRLTESMQALSQSEQHGHCSTSELFVIAAFMHRVDKWAKHIKADAAPISDTAAATPATHSPCYTPMLCTEGMGDGDRDVISSSTRLDVIFIHIWIWWCRPALT